jgi:hypothetical protein
LSLPPTGPFEGPASFAIDGLVVNGTVLAADPEIGTFVFVTAEPPDDDDQDPFVPQQGTLVRIQWGDRLGFAAEARVLEVQDHDRWILSVPVNIDPDKMRQATRVMGEGIWTFSVKLGTSVEVYDLSERGLGLVFPSGEGPASRGVTLHGVLQVEGVRTWEVNLLCTNVRAYPRQESLWIVGGKIDFEYDKDRENLQAIVKSLTG